MFGSEIVEIRRVEAKRRSVMPAQAGMHLRGHRKADKNLDSGVRRNDDEEKSSSIQPIRSPSLNREPFNFIISSHYCSGSVLGALS